MAVIYMANPLSSKWYKAPLTSTPAGSEFSITSSVFFSVQLYTKCAVLRLICAVLKTNLCSSKITLCSCAKNDRCKTCLKCSFGTRRIQNFLAVMLAINWNNGQPCISVNFHVHPVHASGPDQSWRVVGFIVHTSFIDRPDQFCGRDISETAY